MFSASVNIIGVSAYRNRKVAIDLDCLEPSKATELPNATTIMRRDRRGAGEGDIKSPIAVPQRPCSDQRERLRDFVDVFRRGGAKGIVMALSYCRARNLDPFKRPVHIVPMWSSVAGKMIETVGPASPSCAPRRSEPANTPALAAFGPTIERTFEGKAGRGKAKGQERSLTLQFPAWCRVTITRELNGKERSFVGPKVYWCEAYAKWADTDVPNEMWANRPVGQLEKCAEAGALRRAFPEEIGNALTAEEMEGQHTLDGAAHAPEKPKPESVTPPRAGGERKPLPPLVSQPPSLTASPSAELPEPFAARQEGDPEIPDALAPASE